MNPLQEHPHLFTNGKFKVRYDEGGECEYDYLFDGIVNRMGLLLILKDPNKPKEFEVEPNECTLIARPIEDMTDEEVKLCGWLDKENHEKAATAKDLTTLLSIGVYPFDKSHFDDGIVIDSRTI